MELRKYIREMVEAELDEMARISTNIKIGDPEKAAIAKELYAGTWYGDMIDYVEEAGATGIPQPELARMLGKSGQQAINPKVRDFLESNIFTKGELSIPKKEKPETTGIKGRPTSEKTLMVKAIGSKMVADDNYQPTEDELEMLGAEIIERIRKKVKGLVKRGRKPGAAKAKDGMVAAMKNIMDTTDEDGDGDVDDEDLDLEDIAESTAINEQFLKMQKLAGLITENEFKKKLEEVARVINSISISDRLKGKNVDDIIKQVIPTAPGEQGKENVEKRNIAKIIFDTVKNTGENGITIDKLASELKKDKGQILSIVQTFQYKNPSLFNFFYDEKPPTRTTPARRPILNR